MAWQVEINRKVDRVLFRFPFRVRKTLFALVSEIEPKGPVRGNWPNFGKFSDNRYHCHETFEKHSLLPNFCVRLKL